ncbi:MAG: hypothetical protein LM590_06660 [Thermofilum sp.]|nr:hypothetical protein [Thermofilum sp.]
MYESVRWRKPEGYIRISRRSGFARSNQLWEPAALKTTRGVGLGGVVGGSSSAWAPRSPWEPA